MNQPCPLPIDWLDYLDGQSDRQLELEHHLTSCLACQVFVSSMQATPIATLQTPWASKYDGMTNAVWTEDQPPTPAPAEFWFSASNFDFGDYPAAAPVSNINFSYENVNRTLLLVI